MLVGVGTELKEKWYTWTKLQYSLEKREKGESNFISDFPAAVHYRMRKWLNDQMYKHKQVRTVNDNELGTEWWENDKIARR